MNVSEGASENYRTVSAAFDNPGEIPSLLNDLTENGIEARRVEAQGLESGEGRRSILSTIRTWLSDLGLTSEDNDLFCEIVRRGGAVVSVHEVRDEQEIDTISRIFSRHGAVDIDDRAHHFRRQGFASFDDSAPMFSAEESVAERERYTPSGEFTIPVVEENVEIGKRQVQRGSVRVVSRVQERPVEKDLKLREETIEVDRRRVDRPLEPGEAQPFQEGVFEMTETDEVPTVKREAHVVEEVRVRKDVEEREEHIQERARRSDVTVERQEDRPGR